MSLFFFIGILLFKLVHLTSIYLCSTLRRMTCVTAQFFVNFIFMCLYMLVCDYLSLDVFSWVFVLEGYFGLLVSKGNLVIP